MFIFFSNRLGCLGSLAISLVLTAILFLVFRGCNAGTVTVDASKGTGPSVSTRGPVMAPEVREVRSDAKVL